MDKVYKSPFFKEILLLLLASCISTSSVSFFFRDDAPDNRNLFDDDLIFEDFARLRLKGGETEA